MTTIGTSSLYSGTINGLNSLDLDTLNVNDLDVNNIDGDFFSINTIECNDLQVDNELDLTSNGFIKIGKNTPTEITITDTELGYLDGVSSNIQNQLNTLDVAVDAVETNISILQADLNTAETDIQTLEDNTRHITSAVYDTFISDSTANIIDAPVDNSITNLLSPTLTHFDKSMVFLRDSGSYRSYFLGMTGDNTNFTNRFAIGCNGINADSPTILMELDETGEISMRNGLKIFDLLGNNVGTINNFQDSPNNSTFTIEAPTGNLFLTTPSIIDCWAGEMRLGKLNGSTLWMRSDTANAYKSRIIFDNLVLYGGLANTGNDALIHLNGEIQNHAYTDADHTAVQGIANIETDISTLQSDVATLQSDVATLETDVGTLQNEMEAVELLAGLTATSLNDNFYRFNPTGTVLTFAGNTLPTGYLWCNGAQLSQITYADLYAVIGLTYSKDRKTSPASGYFFLPDMRGLFVCGAGVPQSTSFVFNSNTYAKTTGDFNQMSVQNHKHRTQTSSGTQSCQIGTASARNNATQTRTSDTGVYYDDGTTPLVKNATEPFNICMNYIIKY
jgi:microcystin-dependent protein/outer membrane murein-binding lipoprotein Lpp